MKTLVVGVVTTVLGVVLGVVGVAAGSTVWHPPPRTHWMKTECAEQEFVTNCAYNGRLQNGGHSYYSVTRKVIGLDGEPTGRRVICIFYPERDLRKFEGCHIQPRD